MIKISKINKVMIYQKNKITLQNKYMKQKKYYRRFQIISAKYFMINMNIKIL